jgi:hypothetical protein
LGGIGMSWVIGSPVDSPQDSTQSTQGSLFVGSNGGYISRNHLDLRHMGRSSMCAS